MGVLLVIRITHYLWYAGFQLFVLPARQQILRGAWRQLDAVQVVGGLFKHKGQYLRFDWSRRSWIVFQDGWTIGTFDCDHIRQRTTPTPR